jgi:ABC-2 type transport system permease protein
MSALDATHPAAAPATSARPSLARDLRLVAWQIRYTQRSFWRNRRAAIMSMVFPLMFLAIFGSLNQGSTIDTRGNLKFIDFFVPGIIAYAVMLTTFTSTAMTFTALRERGILKRLRTTPLPWSVYVAGIVGSTLLVMIASTAVLLVVGIAVFGAHVPTHTMPAVLIVLALGSSALTMLGIAASRLVPNVDSGMGVLTLITLPLTFVSNIFYPLDGAPGWLEDIAKAFPLRPLADGLQHAFDPDTTDLGLVGHDVLTLALWAVAGAVLMLRSLRTLREQS